MRSVLPGRNDPGLCRVDTVSQMASQYVGLAFFRIEADLENSVAMFREHRHNSHGMGTQYGSSKHLRRLAAVVVVVAAAGVIVRARGRPAIGGRA